MKNNELCELLNLLYDFKKEQKDSNNKEMIDKITDISLYICDIVRERSDNNV